MFGLISKLVGTLFGGSKTKSEGLSFAQEAAKGVAGFIDENNFTEQEGAEMRLATGKMLIKAIESTKDENSVRSVTRRYLAWGVTGYVVLWASVAMVLVIMGRTDTVNDMLAVANRFYVGEAFVSAMAFYFMAGIVRTAKG